MTYRVYLEDDDGDVFIGQYETKIKETREQVIALYDKQLPCKKLRFEYIHSESMVETNGWLYVDATNKNTWMWEGVNTNPHRHSPILPDGTLIRLIPPNRYGISGKFRSNKKVLDKIEFTHRPDGQTSEPKENTDTADSE